MEIRRDLGYFALLRFLFVVLVFNDVFPREGDVGTFVDQRVVELVLRIDACWDDVYVAFPIDGAADGVAHVQCRDSIADKKAAAKAGGDRRHPCSLGFAVFVVAPLGVFGDEEEMLLVFQHYLPIFEIRDGDGAAVVEDSANDFVYFRSLLVVEDADAALRRLCEEAVITVLQEQDKRGHIDVLVCFWIVVVDDGDGVLAEMRILRDLLVGNRLLVADGSDDFVEIPVVFDRDSDQEFFCFDLHFSLSPFKCFVALRRAGRAF